jgi:hypothetical protein
MGHESTLLLRLAAGLKQKAERRPAQPTMSPLIRESSTDADAGSECQRTVRLRRPPAAGVEERID